MACSRVRAQRKKLHATLRTCIHDKNEATIPRHLKCIICNDYAIDLVLLSM